MPPYTTRTVMDVFMEFVRQRQMGMSRDEAWEQIADQRNALSQRDQGRLLALLRAWETKEGRHYRPSRQEPNGTQFVAPETVNKLRNEMEAKRTVIRRIQPPKHTVNTKPGMICPACQKVNRADETYCYSCGTLLVPVGMTQQLNETQPVSALERDTSYFDDHMTLCLQVRGAPQMIRVKPREDEMIIGRKSPDSVMLPDIDLSPYQADALGVSRLHAGLRRHENTLILTDLGSLNHTHINGQRLHAHEVRVLHDNDELRFGQLLVRVFFRRD